MKLRPSLSSNSLTLFITALVVFSIFGFYFLIHVPDQQQKIIQNNYRFLQKMGNNINERYQELTFDLHKDSNRFTRAEVAFEKIRDHSNYSIYFSQILACVKDTSDTVHLMNQSDEDSGLVSDLLEKVDSNAHEISSFGTSFRLFAHRISLTEYNGKANLTLYLVGLISKKELTDKARQIRPIILITITLFIVILIISMPLLKLVSLSPIESLNRSNILWLGISLVIGTGCIVLFLSYIFAHLQSKANTKKHLTELAIQVKNSFEEEITESLAILHDMNSSSWTLQADRGVYIVYDSLMRSSRDMETIPMFSSDSLKSWGSKYSELFWLDTTGIIRTYYTQSSDYPDLQGRLDVSQRPYFRNLHQSNLWKAPQDSSLFTMQSVVNYANGAVEAVLAIKSSSSYQAGNKVAIPLQGIALSQHMTSVMDPIVPPGYSFVLIDQSGAVLFHSNKQKNLKENFIEEITQADKLKSAMDFRIRTNLELEYLNEKQWASMLPLDNLPIFVVALYDQRHQQSRMLQILLTSMVLFVIYLIIMGIQVLGVAIISQQKTKLAKKYFFMDWVFPKSADHQEYWTLFLCNLIFIAFLLINTGIIFYLRSPSMYYSLEPISLIIILQISFLSFTYYIYHKISNTAEKDLKLVSRNEEVDYWNIRHGSKKRIFIIYSLALVVIANFVLILNLRSHWLPGVISQATLFLIMLLLYRLIGDQKNPATKFSKIATSFAERFGKPFPLFITSWLIISIAIPSFYFYRFSKAWETKTWAKYEQLLLAKALNDRDQDSPDAGFVMDNDFAETAGLYYRVSPESNSLHAETSSGIHRVAPTVQTLLSLPLASKEDFFKNSRELIHDQSSDKTWNFTYDNPGTTMDLMYASHNSNGTIRLRQVLDPSVFTFSWVKVLSALLFFILLWIAYKIISYTIRKIFATDYKGDQRQPSNIVEFLEKREMNKRIFLIRVENFDCEDYLSRYIQRLDQDDLKYVRVDLTKLNDVGYHEQIKSKIRDAQVVILDDFAFLSNNHAYNELKLELLTKLEKLPDSTEKQLIITSGHDPLRIVKYYKTMIRKSSEHKWEDKFRDEYEKYRHAHSQWKKLFEGYVKIYIPIEKKELEGLEIHNYQEPIIQQLLTDELSFGTYLRKLEPLIHDFYLKLADKNLNDKREEIILRIQSLAEPYYQSLWSALTKPERILLFDLARDGFANVKNGYTIRQLKQRGLLIYTNNLRIMNQSFNNFVLTVVNREIEEVVKVAQRHSGNWNLVKHLIIILVIAGIAFVAIGQPHLMKNVNALIGAIVAVIGLFLRTNFFRPGEGA